MKGSPEPNSAIMKQREIITAEQYLAIFEELSKEIAAEDESDALYLDREVTEYSDLKTNHETDLENSPGHEEYRLIVEHKCLYHPSIQPLILLYHKE
ncbi:hypothetical protein AVEN_107858-1 [Araneus ventricosus]|uniref:Uncharacterized protein n=1 Tax=Araneus ventricosus TaxID=182803 RepID=A0A4Y2IVX0_ARAVE|nr:hypothetical protein AVEN_107858-1 [Araneus ventricosus]